MTKTYNDFTMIKKGDVSEVMLLRNAIKVCANNGEEFYLTSRDLLDMLRCMDLEVYSEPRSERDRRVRKVGEYRKWLNEKEEEDEQAI